MKTLFSITLGLLFLVAGHSNGLAVIVFTDWMAADHVAETALGALGGLGRLGRLGRLVR